MKRLSMWAAAALAVVAMSCGGGTTCRTNAECARGQVCSASKCVAGTGGSGGGAATGGGMGTGGSGGGVATGGGDAGGGTATGGGTGGTGGGTATGGGTGGTGGGTATGGGTGGTGGGTATGGGTGGTGGTGGGTATGGGTGGTGGGTATGGGTGGTGGGTATGGGTGGTGGGTATGGGTGGTGGGTATGGGTGGTGGGTATGGGAGGGTAVGLCDNAVALTSGTRVAGSTDGGNAFRFTADGGCFGSLSLTAATAGDRVFSIAVPNGQRLTATLNGPDGGADTLFDSTFNIVIGAAACGTNVPDAGTVGIACSAGADDPEPQTITYDNETGSTQTAFLIVDGYSSGVGDFTLLARTAQSPALLVGGETCGTGPSMMPNTVYRSSTVGGTSDYAFPTVTQCRASNVAPDKTYDLTVPPMTKAVVTVVPAATFDPSVSITNSAANCGSGLGVDAGTQGANCVAGINVTGVGSIETVEVNNVSAMPTTYTVIVDSNSTTATARFGTFDISSATTPLPALVAGGETCATAATLAVGTFTGTTVGATNDYAFATATGCRASGTSGDTVYTVTVPARSRGSVTATTLTPGFAPTVNVISGVANCGALQADAGTGMSTCVANNNISSNVGFSNTSMADATYQVVVDGTVTSTPATGAFQLVYATTPLPSNDTCAAPTTLPTNMTLAQTWEAFGADHAFATATGCRLATGKDAVYSVSVPNGQQLTVTLDSSTDTVLNLIDGTTGPVTCGAGATCVAASDSGNPEVASYINNSGSMKTIYVVASAYSSTTATGAFSLSATIAPPPAPAGETCAMPTSVAMAGTTLWTTIGATRDYTALGAGCTTATGPEGVFQVTVPVGQTLTFTVTSATDSVINVVDTMTCAATAQVCLATRDLNGSNASEVYTFTNSGTQPKALFLLVSAYSSLNTTTMNYSVTVALQ